MNTPGSSPDPGGGELRNKVPLSVGLILSIFWALAWPVSPAAAQKKKPEYVLWPMKRYPLVSYSGLINENGVISGDQYYLTAAPDLVYAIDLKLGKIAWQFKAKARISFPPLVVGASVITVDDEGVVYALDEKGKVSWTLPTKERPGGKPARLGDHVILFQKTGIFSVLDLKTKKIVGKIEADGAAIDSWLVTEDRLYAVLRTGVMVVFSPEGKETARMESETPYRGPFMVLKNHILAGKEGGVLESYDLIREKRRWTRKLGTDIRAISALDDKRICVIGMNDILFCLSRKTGDLLWWRGGPTLDIHMPLVWQNRIAGTFSTSEIFGLDDRTGESRWRFDVGRKIVTDPQLWRENMIVNMYTESNNQGCVQIQGPDVPAKAP